MYRSRLGLYLAVHSSNACTQFVFKSTLNTSVDACSFCALHAVSPCTHEETATVRAPVKDLKSKRGFKWIDIEMLEPFSLIQYLWNDVGLQIDENQVRTFWTEHRNRGTAWAVRAESTDFIPLGLYGDSCRIRHIAHQPVQKAVGIFLNCPLFRPNNARASRWLLCTIDENLLFKHVTLNRIYARLVWSLNMLWEDRFPACGPFGEAIPERFRHRVGKPITGKRFQVVELRGDWVWHKQVLRFNSTWLAGARKPVCFLCPAYRTGAHWYTNVTESNPLWDCQYDCPEFIRCELPSRGPSSSARCSNLALLVESVFM